MLSHFVSRFQKYLFILLLHAHYNLAVTSSDIVGVKCPDLSTVPEIEIDCSEECKDLILAGNGTLLGDTTLKLHCTASYPIFWDFVPPYDLYKVDLKSKVIQDKNANSTTSLNYCYEEVLTISKRSAYTAAGRTGNYTCRSLLKPELASWKYLYIRDSYKIFSPSSSESIVYSELLNGEEWSIPCKSHIGILANVTLINESTQQNWTTFLLDLNSTVRYDTKRGFLLNKFAHSRPEGYFTCKALFGPTFDSVKMTIFPYNAIPSKEFVDYSSNYKFSVQCEYDEPIKIDWDEVPNLSLIGKSNYTNPSFKFAIKYVFMANPNNYSTGEIKCVTLNNSKILHVWNHNLDKFCNCTSSILTAGLLTAIRLRQNSPSVSFTCAPLGSIPSSSISRQSTTVKYSYCQDRTKYNIFQKYFDIIYKNEVYYGYDYDSYGRRSVGARSFRLDYSNNVLACTVGDYTTYSAPIASLQGFIEDEKTEQNRHSDKMREKIQLSLSVSTGTNDTHEFFTGDFVNFTCVVSRYDSLGPFKWSFHYRNGSTMDTISVINQTTWELSWGIVGSIKVPVSNELHLVTCSALLWASTTEWVTKNATLDDLFVKVYQYKVADASDYGKCDSISPTPVITMKRNARFLYSSTARDKLQRLQQHYVTDSDLFFDTVGYQLILNCTASYPIQWFFQDEPFLNTSTLSTSSKMTANGRMNRIFTDTGINQDNVNNNFPCFVSTIIVDPRYITSTGEYSCRKHMDNSVKSFVYLYTSYNEPAHLIQAGHHLYVTVNQSKEITNLPCRTTHPSHLLNIYKHEGQKEPLVKLEKENDYDHYNPKTGFIFKTSNLDLASLYICTVGNETDPEKTISISLVRPKIEKDFINGKPQQASVYEDDENLNRLGFISLQFVNFLLIICVLTVVIWSARRRNTNEERTVRPMEYYSYNKLTENDSY